MAKPRLGIFKLSCCSGCEAQIFHFQRQIAEVLQNFDIVNCQLVQSSNEPLGPFDLALIEGSVTQPWQIDLIKEIRHHSALVYAIGSCAVTGGIPAMKRNTPAMIAEQRVYKDTSIINAIEPAAVSRYIKTDASLKGCPPGEESIIEVLSSILLHKSPSLNEYCVCVDCKVSANTCLLIVDNAPCLGPVTNSGCDALCPSVNRPCFGCFGPVDNANTRALALEFENRGHAPEDISRLFTEFGSASVKFLIGADIYD